MDTAPADRRVLAAIFVGGFAGTVARAELALALPAGEGQWPWATLLVNIAGAFLLGWLSVRPVGRLPHSDERMALLGTGLCGALTTFSALQLELLQMLDAGRAGSAAAYVLVSVGAGLAAVALARRAAGRTGLRA